jgi:hypothetical protein
LLLVLDARTFARHLDSLDAVRVDSTESFLDVSRPKRRGSGDEAGGIDRQANTVKTIAELINRLHALKTQFAQ